MDSALLFTIWLRMDVEIATKFLRDPGIFASLYTSEILSFNNSSVERIFVACATAVHSLLWGAAATRASGDEA